MAGPKRPRQYFVEAAWRRFGARATTMQAALWNAPAELDADEAEARLAAFLARPPERVQALEAAAAEQKAAPAGVEDGIDLVEFCGHSLAGGGGASRYELGYWHRLARLLQARQAKQYAIGGAVIAWPQINGQGDGGWGRVVQDVPRVRVAGRYLPQSQIVVAHTGENDLAQLGKSKLLPYEEALRTILSRFCAAAVWEAEGGAPWTFAGAGWTTFGIVGTSGASSGIVQACPTVGATATFALPADYPGGLPVAFPFFVNPVWGEMRYGVKIDGVAQPDIVIDGAQVCDQAVAGKHNLVTRRYGVDSPLAAGAHTFEFTLKSGPFMCPDCAQVEADPLDGPLLVAPLAVRPFSYAIWNTWAHGPNAGTDPINDAAIDVLRTRQLAVLGEFGSRVVTVDIDSLFAKQQKYFSSDLTHWSDLGHTIAAEAIYDALRASPALTRRVLSRPVVDTSPLWRRYGQFPNPSHAASWVNFDADGSTSIPRASFHRDLRGIAHLRFGVKNGVVGSSPLGLLPVEMRPGRFHAVTDFHTAGAANVVGLTRVQPDGAVAPVVTPAGTTNALWELSTSYIAEGG